MAETRRMPGPSWVPAGRRLKAWECVPVAEPVSRAAPKEIASGISFRDGDLPHARCVELVKVCDFYEAKASASYVDSALCGRYLHALAREVRALALALREAERARRRRVADLEAVCAEWAAHFGPRTDGRGRLDDAQGALGLVPLTPAALAAERAQTHARIARLEAELAETRADAANAAERANEDLAQFQAASRAHAESERARRNADAAAAKAAFAEERRATAAHDAARHAAARGAALDATHGAAVTAAREIAQARADAAALDAERLRLGGALRDAEARIEAHEATTSAALDELATARAHRRRAVDAALEADAVSRRGRNATAATQTGDSPAAVAFLPCARRATPGGAPSAEAMRSVVAVLVRGAADGDPDAALLNNVRALGVALATRLGVAVVAARRTRAGTVELVAATRHDAARLLEARELPRSAAVRVLVPRKRMHDDAKPRAAPPPPPPERAARGGGDAALHRDAAIHAAADHAAAVAAHLLSSVRPVPRRQ